MKTAPPEHKSKPATEPHQPLAQPEAEREAGLGVGMPFFLASAAPPPVQPKLRLNRPGDRYEQEADRVAAQVMRMPLAPADTVQRACSCGGTCAHCQGGDEAPLIQRELAGSTSAPPSAGTVLPSTNGQPIDAPTRQSFEARFGHDFSGVRIHTGSQASDKAASIQARAFTTGNNIVFGAGAYAPGTQTGQTLLAHELAHVVQQRQGRALGIQREVVGDIRTMSINETWAQALTDDELQDQITIVQQQLQTESPETPEFEAARSNLAVLEQVHTERTLQQAGMAGTLLESNIPRPPGLPLDGAYMLLPFDDLPPDIVAQLPEGEIVPMPAPQVVPSFDEPMFSAPIVAMGEMVGQAAVGAEGALISSSMAQPGGLLGQYSPFARPPTAAESAMIRAGRAFHYTPAQNAPLISRGGGTIMLRPSTGVYRNLLTPFFEPSSYAFAGQPNAAQQTANLAGRGALGQQALVVIEGADLPPGTLYRPLDRTIVMPRGYQGPGAVIEPGGQMPLSLRNPGSGGGAAAVEGTAAQNLTRFRVMRFAGRAFIVVGVVATGYEIATAPPETRTRTAIGATSGFVGGLAFGAAAGLACGPGAPVCSVLLGIGFGIAGGIATRSAAEGIYDAATR
ncbi:DUF4157 domain-containing protein [Candidatus Chloroploca asiatica]|uniref:eCIS core domain-containing protein n=1 Tax=Candidatus Chloroploca asiatica TaxID=1506545 RepID=A0A2H3KRN9_9CHLR|nr:DUF4157 domain-containing protein [Candidatus Chloroploca asiatica]PDV97880.1 hypothetical protein A9Q02_17055 [Candidatus Chloroploca asiatica]